MKTNMVTRREEAASGSERANKKELHQLTIGCSFLARSLFTRSRFDLDDLEDRWAATTESEWFLKRKAFVINKKRFKKHRVRGAGGKDKKKFKNLEKVKADRLLQQQQQPHNNPTTANQQNKKSRTTQPQSQPPNHGLYPPATVPPHFLLAPYNATAILERPVAVPSRREDERVVKRRGVALQPAQSEQISLKRKSAPDDFSSKSHKKWTP